MPNVLMLATVHDSMKARYKQMLQERFQQLTFNAVSHHDEVYPFIADADVLLTFSPPMADNVVRDAPKLKLIQVLGTGIDNIVDLPSLGPEVIVANIRGIHGAPMSEAAFAYMLSLARDLRRSAEVQARSTWERWPPALLDGKTVGILGVGLIAEHLAPMLKAFNMTVVGISSGVRAVPGFDRMVARDEMLRAVGDLDFLVVLTPYSPETHHIINAELLAAMKPSAYLVNLARGGVIDEAALMQALERGTIAGAALDVFEEEPLPPESPIWKTKNLLAFPHLGGYSQGYEMRAMPTIEHNLRCLFGGDVKNMINVVRKPTSWGD